MDSNQSRKYSILTRILDKYVLEGATVKQRKSQFDTSTEERQNQARSRAFIHLYLAAEYGILGFEDRERMITDASYDGGIDGYFIDTDNKIIDIIQSKFRVGSTNFESKNITPEEIVAVDLDRILEGHTESKSGKSYNGYIQAFIEKIKSINDIARYKIKVTLLANVKKDHYPLVERLFAGDEINIVDFERCYGELVMPTIRGEQHYTASMRLQIDLSNKSNKSRLSAEVNTAHGPSQVTVILAPTIEIAQIMSRYKNAILRYNPRSYLEFKDQRTNEGIAQSILDIETGEFAILNNGITIVSDETYVSERVGSMNRAQVEIVNPQIINGGQTAFTLCRIFEETAVESRVNVFSGKEVVVRIITLPALEEEDKKNLILSISSATNSQTAVSSVDRTASNDENRRTAEVVFKRTGLLYEPKRGEYSDALRNKYIDENDIIDRVLFTRLMHLACGRNDVAVDRRMMKNTGGVLPEVTDIGTVDRFMDLYEVYTELTSSKPHTQASDKMINELLFATFVHVLRMRRRRDGVTDWTPKVIEEARSLYEDLTLWARENVPEFLERRVNKDKGEIKVVYASQKWRRSARYLNDIQTYVESLELQPKESLISYSGSIPVQQAGIDSASIVGKSSG